MTDGGLRLRVPWPADDGLADRLARVAVEIRGNPEGTAGAIVGPRYRYTLWRSWDGDGQLGRVLWVMLNPSTANHLQDDATIRRCCGYAKAWGFGGIWVANLFAWRATDPRDLCRAVDEHGLDLAAGPGNDEVIARLADQAPLAVMAWGAHPIARYRAQTVADLLGGAGQKVAVLRLTDGGHPHHPLRLPGALRPLDPLTLREIPLR